MLQKKSDFSDKIIVGLLQRHFPRDTFALKEYFFSIKGGSALFTSTESKFHLPLIDFVCHKGIVFLFVLDLAATHIAESALFLYAERKFPIVRQHDFCGISLLRISGYNVT